MKKKKITFNATEFVESLSSQKRVSDCHWITLYLSPEEKEKFKKISKVLKISMSALVKKLVLSNVDQLHDYLVSKKKID